MPRRNVHVEVHLRDREPQERMIKRFLNKVKKEKIVEEVQNKRYYESPSEEKARLRNRRKRVLAKLRRERESFDRPTERK